MRRYEMIKDKKLFNNIIRKGSFVKDENFVIYYMLSKNINPKFGIAVKKKLGTAVVRNKVKRQTRALIDKNKKGFKNGYNYIIMIREKSLVNNFNSMNISFVKLLERIK